MNLTFAANLTKMIDAGLGREAAPPETFVAVGRTTEYTDLGPVPIASFETNVESALRALSVSMEPFQAGTGDPSPENVRPITGRSAVKVMRSGGNMLPTFLESASQSGITMTLNADGSVTVNGTATLTVTFTAPASDFKWDGITPMWLSGCPAGGSYAEGYSLRVDAHNVGAYSRPDVGNGIPLMAYGDHNLVNKKLKFCIVIRSGTVCNNLTFRPMLNFGTSAKPFEPYKPIQTVTLQLGQTVYGGSLDVVSGVLTVDTAMVDLGGATWTYQSSSIRFFSDFVKSTIVKTSAFWQTPAVCSAYKVILWSSLADKFISISNDGRLFLKNTDYTDPDALKASLSGVQFCYELDKPLTIQLTPEQITTLIGANNVWSDGGDVSLTYGTVKYTEGY